MVWIKRNLVVLWATTVVAVAGCGGSSDAGSSGAGSGSGGDGNDETGGLDPAQCGPLVPGPALDDPACAGIEAQPIADPTTDGDALINRALAAARQQLHTVVGQYACGTASVYRGNLAASDNSGDVCCGRDDGEMQGASVTASLVRGAGLIDLPGQGDGPHLFVFSPDEQRRLRIHQESGGARTFVSLVSDYRSSYGIAADCDGCLVDLVPPPAQIDIDLAANGMFGGGDPLIVDASGTLDEIPSERVSWADLLVVNDHPGEGAWDAVTEFEACGPLTIRDVRETYVEPAPAPVGSSWRDGECTRSVSYTARWWVDPARIARHGIVDFAPQPAYCCEEVANGVGPFDRECFDL